MQVMTSGQRGTFEFYGNNYVFTVTQATVEGQERSHGIERGMICADTYIVFAASNSSGIKVEFFLILKNNSFILHATTSLHKKIYS